MKRNAEAEDSAIQVFNNIISEYRIYCYDAVYAIFYGGFNMMVDRELLMKRKYIWVEGEPEIPFPIVLYTWKKHI